MNERFICKLYPLFHNLTGIHPHQYSSCSTIFLPPFLANKTAKEKPRDQDSMMQQWSIFRSKIGEFVSKL